MSSTEETATLRRLPPSYNPILPGAAVIGERDSRVLEAELRSMVRPVNRVWPNAPRAEAFFPLVVLLVAVLPWIHLRAHLQMNPDLAAAGLRALDLLHGEEVESAASKPVAPPFPLWAQSVALASPLPDKSLAAAAPSTLFAILAGLVLYRLGSVWFSPAVGVLASLFLVCNSTLIEQIHRGEPGPIVLFFTLAALWPFAEHLRRQDDVFSRWTLIGGVALAGLFLTAGAYALSIAILGLGAMFFREADEEYSLLQRLRFAVVDPTTRAGVVTLLLGTAIATPWLAQAPWQTGPWFPWNSPSVFSEPRLSWWDAAASAPALVVLGVFGLLRSLRALFRHGPSAGEDGLPILWTLLAGFAFHFAQRTPAALLVLAAPMFLLAARVILDVFERRLGDHQVLLAAASVICVYAFWQTFVLSGASARVQSDGFHWRKEWLAAARGAGAVLVALSALTILFRWTQGGDDRRRWLFGGLVLAVIAVACAPGVMLLRAPQRSHDRWHQVQQRLAALVEAEKPDSVLLLDGSTDGAGSRRSPSRTILEFLVRTAAPNRERRIVAKLEDVERNLADFENPLVVVVHEPSRRKTARLPKIYSIAHGSRAMTLTERLDNDLAAVYSPLASASAE